MEPRQNDSSSQLPILKFVEQLERAMFEENMYYSKNMELQHEISMRLLRIILSLQGRGEKYLKLFHDAEKELDVHILPCSHNFSYKSPMPKVCDLPDTLWDTRYDAGIDWNEQECLALLKTLTYYSEDYAELLKSGRYDESKGQFWFHDAAIYYCMIRHFAPKKIIEVGAGGSTILAKLAFDKLGNRHASLTSIDPFYEGNATGFDEVLRKPVQQVPPREFIDKLERNDILFIDGSHVSKIGSDVNYLFLEILPLLKEGVIVHVHDICLPEEMPKAWIKSNLVFWNEQYLLNAFLIFNSHFKILMPVHYMQLFHPHELKKVYDYEPVSGASFWIQKR